MDVLSSRRSAAENALHRLMKRCVECPDDTPVCAKCKEDESCTLRPKTCDKCAYMQCVPTTAYPGQQQVSSNSTSIGGIAGGVIGGLIGLCLLVYLVWRFYLRDRRRSRRDTWISPEKPYEDGASHPLRGGSRPHSIASTVLTQASNVIQIAYIPGVTVRSAPDTPEVPTIPSSYASTSANSTPHLEEFRFMPSRDSTWSDGASMHSGNRISISPSLNRASVATADFHVDALVPPIPAQYVQANVANVVNIRSGSTTPNTGRSSPVQAPMNPRVQQLQQRGGNQIVARNLTARPVEIKKSGSASKVPTMANLAAATNTNNKKEVAKTRKVKTPSISDEKEVVSLMSPTTTLFDESPTSPLAKPRPAYGGSDNGSASGISAVLPADGPLGSSSTAAQRNGNNTTADISAMILNAMKSASQDAAHSHQRPDVHKHDSGPFSDANEIKENRTP